MPESKELYMYACTACFGRLFRNSACGSSSENKESRKPHQFKSTSSQTIPSPVSRSGATRRDEAALTVTVTDSVMVTFSLMHVL